MAGASAFVLLRQNFGYILTQFLVVVFSELHPAAMVVGLKEQDC
jgi:hypothetical protein